MAIELKDKNGEWFEPDFEPTDEQLAKWQAEGRVRPLIDSFGISEQESRINARKEQKANWGWPEKIGDYAHSMIAPVSHAYGESQLDKGEKVDPMKYAAAGAADVSLAAFSPLRLGAAGLKAVAPKAAAKIGSILPNSLKGTITGQRFIQGTGNAANAVSDGELTQMAVNAAEGKDLTSHFGTSGQAASDIITGAIGAGLGVKKANFKNQAIDEAIDANKRASQQLVASVPLNIRLNERAGHYVDEAGNLGSSKNKNSVQMAKEIFSDPNKSLSAALAENEGKIQNLIGNIPPAMSDNLFLQMKFIPPERNIQKSVSDNIDLARNELLQDMLNRGYINEEGVIASQIPNIRTYLNNSINWNKNQQGITRSAPDEKAARELYREINNALDAASHVPEFKRLRDWDRAYSEALVEADLLTGISDKRARIDFGNDYYPTRDLDLNQLLNENLTRTAGETAADRLLHLGGVRTPFTLMPNQLYDK